MADSMTFLQSVAGAMQTGGPSPVIRLATIDPAYDPDTYPATLPKVTFEGETILSGKTYVALQPYRPEPGDRVLMIPVGNTYIIGGAIDRAAGQVVTQSGSATLSPSSDTSITLVVTFDVPFLAVPVCTTNIASGAGATLRWGSRAISVSTTQLTIYIFATDLDGTEAQTFSAGVDWTATGRVAG